MYAIAVRRTMHEGVEWLVLVPFSEMRGEGRTLDEAKAEFRKSVVDTYSRGVKAIRGDSVSLDDVSVPELEVSLVMGK